MLFLATGKTITVQNLKPNAKDTYCRRLLGKNLLNLLGQKIFDPGSNPKLTLTQTLSVGFGLGLAPGKKISVENLRPNAKDAYC